MNKKIKIKIEKNFLVGAFLNYKEKLEYNILKNNFIFYYQWVLTTYKNIVMLLIVNNTHPVSTRHTVGFCLYKN